MTDAANFALDMSRSESSGGVTSVTTTTEKPNGENLTPTLELDSEEEKHYKRLRRLIKARPIRKIATGQTQDGVMESSEDSVGSAEMIDNLGTPQSEGSDSDEEGPDEDEGDYFGSPEEPDYDDVINID